MPISMPFPNDISQSMTRTAKKRLLSAQFGGGFVQQVGDGLNSDYEIVSIMWENMNLGERNTIIAALKGASTDYIEWTPWDDGVLKRYIVMPNKDATLYTETNVSGVYYTISTELMQVR